MARWEVFDHLDRIKGSTDAEFLVSCFLGGSLLSSEQGGFLDRGVVGARFSRERDALSRSAAGWGGWPRAVRSGCSNARRGCSAARAVCRFSMWRLGDGVPGGIGMVTVSVAVHESSDASTSPVPPQHLHPIHPLGAKHHRHPHPHPRLRDVHRCPRNAEAISAICEASISPSRRTVSSRDSITTDPIGPVALSTLSGANAGCGCGSTSTASADDAPASLPRRARLRHVDNCQREISHPHAP